MTTSLRSTITDLAATFASSILHAIRQMSLDEILAETHGGAARAHKGAPRAAAKTVSASSAGGGRKGRKSGRLERRSASDISAVVGRIVSVLAAKPSGLRAEQIRDALGLVSKEMPRPLAEALKSRRIIKTGEKRATTYFARGAGASKAAGAAGAAGGAKGKVARPAAGKSGGRKVRKRGKRAAAKAAKAPQATATA
jgi:hypothetical protein